MFEISTKFNNNDEIKEICNSIISQLIKILDQEKFIDSLINQCVKDLNSICSNSEFNNKIYDQSKPQILENLEKINTFSSNKKITENIFDSKFLEILKKIQEKVLKDQEISEINDKINFNLVELMKKAYKNDLLNNINNLNIKDFLDHLINVIKEKSHFRDVLLESLKNLSNMMFDENFYEKHIKEKLDKDLIDALFNANENYLEDLPVGSEINNLLSSICMRSDDLAKYIINKGGLQNIIEEIKSLIKLNDPISQSKKLFGLKFIESIVKDKDNMEKFVLLKGPELILNLMKSCIQTQDEENKKKFETIKNTENCEIIKHNNFIIRNSLVAEKDNNSNRSGSLNNNTYLENKNFGIEKNASPINGFNCNSNISNKLGNEIIEELKNENLLNSHKEISVSESRNFNAKNIMFDKLKNYITETCLRIIETNKVNQKKENILKENSIENNSNIDKLEVSSQNDTLDETNNSNYIIQDEIEINEDFLIFEDTGKTNENLDIYDKNLSYSSNYCNKYIPYLVYCFKIILLNLKFKKKDFIDPRLFKNIIQLLR